METTRGRKKRKEIKRVRMGRDVVLSYNYNNVLDLTPKGQHSIVPSLILAPDA